jgi:hypothetical protein
LRRDVEVVEGFWVGQRSSGPALEIRIGPNASIVIGTRAMLPSERERNGLMEPSVIVDRATWCDLRRAFEDLLA